MAYMERALERKFLHMSSFFKAVLVTGARQVGKTTMLKHLTEGQNRTYVTMDNTMARTLAQSDPVLFFQWGISFGALYTVPDKGNRPVAYAGKEALVQAIQEKYPPQEEPQQPKAKEQPPQPGPGDKKLHASAPGRRKTKPGKEREDDRP